MKKIIPILFYVLLLTACNTTDSDAEHRIWQEMKICGTAKCYQSYLDKYPNGDYVVAVPEKVISAIQAAKDKAMREQASREQAAKVRVALIENMVTIPSGRFQMGSNNGDSYEKPVHEVRIDSFKMQAHEVTWNLYQPCIDAGVCASDGDAGWGKGNRPVINVSWDDIQTYIQWLNQQTGQRFRLPSEAQWEYAARAGTSTRYSSGNNIDCSKARYGQWSGECGNNRKTVAVKSYAPNAWGLYDMHGNVDEWVQDCVNDTYRGAPSDGSAWTTGNCDRRVRRGGSWYDRAVSLRAADRFWRPASERYSDLGFRLVQDR